MRSVSSVIMAAAAGLAFATSLPSAALSSPVTNLTNATVNVWIYNPGAFGAQADVSNLVTATPSTFQFSYTGALDWINANPEGGSNTGQDFLNGPANIASATFATPAQKTAFLGTTLSNQSETVATFIQITGVLSSTAPLTGTITHDDGASFYVNGVNLIPGVAGPTVAEDTPLSGSAAFYKDASYLLDYIEFNGSPAELALNIIGGTLTTDVPEPSTWAMMILGFFGVGFMAYRRQSKFGVRLA
jgi:hypothetical protein